MTGHLTPELNVVKRVSNYCLFGIDTSQRTVIYVRGFSGHRVLALNDENIDIAVGAIITARS